MKIASIPPNEAERLADLRAHELEASPDEALAALTRTVAHLLDVPIALVSLVDADTQWFKARHGLDVSGTSRDVSFCAHAVASGQPLVVEDALRDERFADNPLVVGFPSIRFYAGIPLTSGSGHELGALCAIDRRPRMLSPEELDRLTDLSKVAMALLAAHRDRARLRQKELVLEEQARRLAARSELLATISHEIRTPLHGVVGTAAVLAESDLAPQHRELVETLVRSAGTVRRIVDDVLDLARAESNKLPIHPRPTDVWTLLEDATDLHASQVDAAGVSLGLHIAEGTHLDLLLDGARVQQIVSNLIGNAAKFTSVGSIVVRASTERAEEADGVILTIAVEDTGPGFPADALSRPFAAYSQPDVALARLHGGSGLGLSVADDLARRMGGTLEVDAAYRAGARVVLRVPARRVSGTVATPPAAKVRGVAVVPDPVDREALRTALRGVANLEVRLVQRPDEARVRDDEQFVLASLGRKAGAAVAVSAGAGTPLVHAARAGTATSTPPGASCVVRLPYRRSRLAMLAQQLQRTAATRSPSTVRGGIRAFVVDDDPTSSRVLAALLRRRGLDVTAFGDAPAALAASRADAPEVVYSDLHMPGMNGIELAAALRQALGAGVRLVVVSATVRDEDRRRCREAGFEFFLEKPFELEDLEGTLRGLVPSDRGPETAPAGETLVAEARFDSVFRALGEEAVDAIRETRALIERHLERLSEVGPDPDAEWVASAHAIASASVQLGLQAVGEAARAIELGERTLSAAERARSVAALRVLVARTSEVLDRRLGPSASGPRPESLPVVRLTLAGDVTPERLSRQLETTADAATTHYVLLIDGRASLPTDPAVGAAFERWYRDPPPHLRRFAMLVSNRLWVPLIEARAPGCPIPMRAFEREADALAWLSAR